MKISKKIMYFVVAFIFLGLIGGCTEEDNNNKNEQNEQKQVTVEESKGATPVSPVPTEDENAIQKQFCQKYFLRYQSYRKDIGFNSLPTEEDMQRAKDIFIVSAAKNAGLPLKNFKEYCPFFE